MQPKHHRCSLCCQTPMSSVLRRRYAVLYVTYGSESHTGWYWHQMHLAAFGPSLHPRCPFERMQTLSSCLTQLVSSLLQWKAKIAWTLAMQRSDSSKQISNGPGTVLTDVIHLSSIVSIVLRNVSLADLASLAVCSKSCAAAMRPHCLELRINRANELHALRSLHRMACLDELEQATLLATEGDCTAGAYLGILGMCPNLRALTLICRITSQHRLDQQKNQVESRELVALAEALPLHAIRTVKFTLSDKPNAPPLHHWVWHPTELASMPELRRD